jgi:hypothetical protein
MYASEEMRHMNITRKNTTAIPDVNIRCPEMSSEQKTLRPNLKTW